MGLVIAESARKHGVTRDEVTFAIANAHAVVPKFSPARVPGAQAPTLWIGPRRLGGELIEVMGEVQEPRTLWIFHAMALRPKFRHYIEETQ
ncbi:hypothetical protein [Arsenicicoccus dermatophilus]|uniref:hypothetical protein n=1 Tax=Arsenicicoccus dermatophilus TaxID=1076331 RepID=UPI001F4CE61C|nr:hypothetical protein [Arsenicicoccus dermatophilus]MCH8614434.1 hypothetical protein [Arsenicicoccus dermatophilus]